MALLFYIIILIVINTIYSLKPKTKSQNMQNGIFLILFSIYWFLTIKSPAGSILIIEGRDALIAGIFTILNGIFLILKKGSC